jgi:hypothetical protein
MGCLNHYLRDCSLHAVAQVLQDIGSLHNRITLLTQYKYTIRWLFCFVSSARSYEASARVHGPKLTPKPRLARHYSVHSNSSPISQGGDLTTSAPTRQPPEVTPCHHLFTSYFTYLYILTHISTLYWSAVPPAILKDHHPAISLRSTTTVYQSADISTRVLRVAIFQNCRWHGNIRWKQA